MNPFPSRSFKPLCSFHSLCDYYSRFRIVSSLLESNAFNPAALVYFKPILSTLVQFIAQEKSSFQGVKAQETVDQIVLVLTNMLNHRKHIPLQAEVLRPVYVSFVSVCDCVNGRLLRMSRTSFLERCCIRTRSIFANASC